MTGSYGDTYLTGLDGTVYWVKECDGYYLVEKSVGYILFIVFEG